ncbi:MAG: DUF4007 family protein [Flavobacteriales bacterium]|nr:DUF4007 family protein [Flavobacteriales bacterium]
MPETFNFSGHETFHCRPFWLKKGHDFLDQKRRFTDEDAVTYLAWVRTWSRPSGSGCGLSKWPTIPA